MNMEYWMDFEEQKQ